jgi:hypothetical protein
VVFIGDAFRDGDSGTARSSVYDSTWCLVIHWRTTKVKEETR